MTDDPEKWCPKCKEFWPATTEFFNRRSGCNRLHSSCRACAAERCRELHILRRAAEAPSQHGVMP